MFSGRSPRAVKRCTIGPVTEAGHVGGESLVEMSITAGVSPRIRANSAGFQNKGIDQRPHAIEIAEVERSVDTFHGRRRFAHEIVVANLDEARPRAIPRSPANSRSINCE